MFLGHPNWQIAGDCGFFLEYLIDFCYSLKKQNYFNFETVFFKKVGPGIIDFFENLTRLGLNCFTTINISWLKKRDFLTKVFLDSKLFIGI